MKSVASIEQNVCVVCCKTYDTGNVLLDKRMRESLDRNTVTGWGLCKKHQTLKDDGYIAIVGCADPDNASQSAMKPDEVRRTGEVCHLKLEFFKGLFITDPPKGGVVFANEAVLQRLETIYDESVSGGSNDTHH